MINLLRTLAMRITVVWKNVQDDKLLRELNLWFMMSFHDYQMFCEVEYDFDILVFALLILYNYIKFNQSFYSKTILLFNSHQVGSGFNDVIESKQL